MSLLRSTVARVYTLDSSDPDYVYSVCMIMHNVLTSIFFYPARAYGAKGKAVGLSVPVVVVVVGIKTA